MSASSRGSRAVVPLLRRTPQLCSRCATLRHSFPAAPIVSRRTYASSTSTTSTTTNPNPNAPSPNILPVTAGNESNPPPNTQYPPQPVHDKSLYRLKAGVILSRPPILTREQTPFESAFYLYQKRMEERTTTSFARQFFYPKGQPASLDFAMKLKDRGTTMQREIGKATRSGRDTWDDELLTDIGPKLADPDYVREVLYIEAESRVSEDGEALSFEDRLRIERPLPRETEADRTGDVRRLDRKLDRTLYLVVKEGEAPNERWTFPQDDCRTDEPLHETAERALEEIAGENMNIWMVGRHPIAVEQRAPMYRKDETSADGLTLKQRGANTFYLKGRIMAGQADLENNGYGITDFKWLTREELKEHLQPEVFSSVEKSLPAQ